MFSTFGKLCTLYQKVSSRSQEDALRLYMLCDNGNGISVASGKIQLRLYLIFTSLKNAPVQ